MNVFEFQISDDEVELKLVKQIDRFDEMMKLQGGVDSFYNDYYQGTIFMNDDLDFIRIDP